MKEAKNEWRIRHVNIDVPKISKKSFDETHKIEFGRYNVKQEISVNEKQDWIEKQLEIFFTLISFIWIVNHAFYS